MSYLLYNKSFDISSDPSSAQELLNKCIDGNDPADYFLIVPTGKFERKLRHKFIRDFFNKTGKPAGRLNVFTIKKFVNYCIDLFYGKGKFYTVSDAYRLALFEEAALEADMKIYKKSGKNYRRRIFPAVLERLAGIIDGLKEDGILPEHLQEDIKSAGEEVTDPRRLTDIYNLYEKYQEKMAAGFLDYPQSLMLLTDFLKNNQYHIDKKFGDKLILLDGFSEFKIPEADLLRTFAERKIKFAVNIDYDRINGPLFGNLKESLERLNPVENDFFRQKDLIHDPIRDASPNTLKAVDYSESGISVTLRKWLFNTERRIHNKALNNALKVFKAETAEDEVDSVTKLVKHLILEENYKPYEICISFRKPDKYSDYFRRSFYNSRIPANISDRFNLNTSIVSGAVFAVLDIVLYQYKRNDIIKALINPLLTFSRENREIDLDSVRYAANKLRIYGGAVKGGSAHWKNRLKNAVEYFDRLVKNADHDDEMYEKSLKNDLAKYRSAYESILNIEKLIGFTDKKYTPSEFRNIIKDKIFKNFNVKENILKLYEEIKSSNGREPAYHKVLELEKNSRAFSKSLEVLEEMCFVLEDIHKDKKFDLSELVNKFKTSVTAAKYQVKERMRYGVEITSIEQTRGIDFKVMILCGAVDGEFPVKYRTETMLGKELKDSADRHLRSEQMQFYQFLTNNTKNLDNESQKIYIFYPGSGEEKELVRSHFIDAALRIAASEEKNDCEFDLKELREAGNKTAEQFPWLLSITSLPELIEYISTGGEVDRKHLNEKLSTDVDFINNNPAIKNTEQVIIENEIELDKIFNEKSYSVSELDEYAACPYKYFAHRILKPVIEEEYSRDLSPLEYGSMLHIILQKFYNWVIDENAASIKEFLTNSGKTIKGARLTPNKYEIYHKKLHELADKEFELFNINNPIFDIEKKKISDPETGWLNLWLNSELKRNEFWRFYPSMFEMSFGMGKEKDIKQVKAGNIPLKGKIDRIELDESPEGSLLFVVADYKSTKSSIKSKSEIVNARSFQMPLYIRAAENMLKEIYGSKFEPAVAVYYPIKVTLDNNSRPNDSFVALASELWGLDTKNIPDLEKVVKSSINEAEKLTNKMQQGIFNVEPVHPSECSNCDFKSICRIRELL